MRLQIGPQRRLQCVLISKNYPETEMRKTMKTFVGSASKALNEAIEIVRLGVIAGAAGGLAEMAWITLYAGATGANPATLARGVTTAAGVNALFPTAPVTLGVTVHMVIAVTLGIALAFIWRMLSSHRSESINPFPFMIAALLGVWTINFFVVLPIVSPAFIHLVPYSISLISKGLFGLAAAVVFRLLATPAMNMSRAQIARRSSYTNDLFGNQARLSRL